nr:flavodoxin [uncultured Oscillibacter sp.]
MKHYKRLLSLALVLVLALSLSIPSLAAVEDTGFSDVAADAWYAGAVAYVREKGIMNGTSAAAFAPDAATTRGQMAAILYRAAGSPGVAGSAAFSDVPETAYYAQAVRWANANGIITGYGDGTFRANNPVTREQMTTILWRYAGSPSAGAASLSDSASVSSYAVSAVNWAASNDIVAAVSGSAFQPQSPATRAQIAAALMNYDRLSQPAAGGTKILIAYFTVPETSGVDAVAQASRVVENGQVVGNVEFIANTIREETGGDVFAIETVQTYPGEHQALLDFAAAEMRANARPELSASISNLDDYDVIFLGYPIWNADLPMPVYSFLDTYDLSGKTVIPFTAHGGSGFAGTIGTVASQEPGAQVERSGFSVSRSSVSEAKGDIADWVRELGYTKAAESQPLPAPDSTAGESVLVAYFSQTGTTRGVARQIAEYTGGDLAEIKRAQPYGSLQDEARAEINNGTHPDITVDADDLDKYGVIFVGYPIWWDDAPAMIATFLAENDFSGKVVAPFCTSSYSPIDNSLHIFRELASGAVIAEALTANSQSGIRPWINRVMSQAGQ